MIDALPRREVAGHLLDDAYGRFPVLHPLQGELRRRVGKAPLVTQQVADGHSLFAVLTELRPEARDRIVPVEGALTVKPMQARRRQGLAVGEQDERGVSRDRRTAGLGAADAEVLPQARRRGRRQPPRPPEGSLRDARVQGGVRQGLGHGRRGYYAGAWRGQCFSSSPRGVFRRRTDVRGLVPRRSAW